MVVVGNVVPEHLSVEASKLLSYITLLRRFSLLTRYPPFTRFPLFTPFPLFKHAWVTSSPSIRFSFSVTA